MHHFSFSSAEDGQEKTNDDAPENNPQYTTVYVGNLGPEVSICIRTRVESWIFISISLFIEDNLLFRLIVGLIGT